eukprot:398109-Rhodomonas_salina.1
MSSDDFHCSLSFRVHSVSSCVCISEDPYACMHALGFAPASSSLQEPCLPFGVFCKIARTPRLAET